MKKLVSVLAISLLLAMVTIVYAQGHEMMGTGSGAGPGMMGEHRILGKLWSLGLDDQQKEAVKEIVRKTMRESIKKRADLDIARLDLRDVLDKDSVNIQAAESKLKQIASMETDIRLLHIKEYEDIKSKLTPDQRKKLKEMIGHGMMMGEMGMMQGESCGMMGGMMRGKMAHGDMVTETPPVEKSEEMPTMEHKH
jgi:Spy/CpxP family protein refolding chaperone